MDRIIKFRGKIKHTNKWIIGDLIQDIVTGQRYIMVQEQELLEPENNFSDLVYKQYEVIPETVCEFANKKDANGTDIYENDIVMHGQSLRKIVRNGCNWIAVRISNSDAVLLSFTEPTIIGNIFDNPRY